MATVVGVLAALVFIGWIIYRAARKKTLKAHLLSYGVAIVAGIFTYAYFLSMDIPDLVKIVVSIVIGIILIIFGALLQRRLSRS